jgi:hypothetical protein
MLVLVSFIAQAQIKEDKNIVILNREGFSGGVLGLYGLLHFGHPKLQINEEIIPSSVFKNFVVRTLLSDSVAIKVSYYPVFSFKRKEIEFRFKLNNRDNHFAYKRAFMGRPELVKVENQYLLKLKEKRSVKKLNKKYDLEY